jgi:hypothetical protein
MMGHYLQADDLTGREIEPQMHDNLNTYWAGYTRQPRRIITLLSDWGIQWTVLGVLRQVYFFRENGITTKTGAGVYALTCVPARWHRLIQEAINIREGHPARAFRFRVTRAAETVNFVKYIIHICNAVWPRPLDRAC